MMVGEWIVYIDSITSTAYLLTYSIVQSPS